MPTRQPEQTEEGGEEEWGRRSGGVTWGVSPSSEARCAIGQLATAVTNSNTQWGENVKLELYWNFFCEKNVIQMQHCSMDPNKFCFNTECGANKV